MTNKESKENVYKCGLQGSKTVPCPRTLRKTQTEKIFAESGGAPELE